MNEDDGVGVVARPLITQMYQYSINRHELGRWGCPAVLERSDGAIRRPCRAHQSRERGQKKMASLLLSSFGSSLSLRPVGSKI